MSAQTDSASTRSIYPIPNVTRANLYNPEHSSLITSFVLPGLVITLKMEAGKDATIQIKITANKSAPHSMQCDTTQVPI